MLENDEIVYGVEQIIANTINQAGGSYLAPTFAGMNTPLFSGNYYSIHGMTTAGYYDSSQTWNGNNNVVMRGDPIITNKGRNNLTGGDGNDVVLAESGSFSTLSGAGGNDILIGTYGTDALGGDGNDLILSGVAIMETPSSGSYLPAWQRMFATVDNMSMETLHNCFGYLDVAGDLVGGAGNDTLIALGDGNNEMRGGNSTGVADQGSDILIAGNGNNKMYGDGGNDFIMAGDGDNIIDGGSGDDNIYAGSGENEISGGAGNDYIEVKGFASVNAGAGNDTISISALDDGLDGGDGFDFVSFAQKDSGVEVGAETWGKLVNIEGVIGSNFADSLMGDDDGAYLDGGAGNDSLQGGAGNDVMTGGAGNDLYFLSGNFGQDTIVEASGAGEDDRAVFTTMTVDTMLYGRNNNDLLFADASQTNLVVVKDWFLNFGVDNFWFATETANQYNVISAQLLADAFGVTIPGTATANAGLFAAGGAQNWISGETLSASVEVVGVAPAAEDAAVSC